MNMIAPLSPVSLATDLSTGAVQNLSAVAKSFETYMSNAVTDAVGTISDGETTMAAGLSGKATAQEVANALIAAETTLQTVINVRDKAISAYTEILRMPV